MAYTSDAIANAFLGIAEPAGEQLTPLKLQKLAYFAHGWVLALDGTPFVDEPIQAWMHGPVIQSMYHEFKEFGNGSITRKAREARPMNGAIELVFPEFHDECADDDGVEYARAITRRIWGLYGHRSANELSNATHVAGTPWRRMFDQFNGNIPHGITIPNEMIREYFAERLKQ